jgi:alpha-1,3-glucan synthase
MVNANTGKYDPRHMIGMTDQDVFRWPSLSHGIQRQLLGWMVTILEIPGIPIFLFGEEQAYYVLENLADDYVFGRNPMSSSRAWQMHGCYKLGETVYTDLPFDSARHGCEDDTVSLDHRDPSHPVRNVLKRMLELRQQYPVLNDGFNLTTLSTKIYNIYLKGSGGLPSPHGIWSVHRGRTGVQDFTGEARGNQGVWFVYHNENHSVHYNFDCESPNASLALISAFPAGKTVKNLFYPYEEYVLEASTIKYGIEDSNDFNGCLPQLEMPPWGWKVLVPIENWQVPSPTITRFLPGHDTRLHSTVSYDEQESIPIQIRFSSAMSCDSVTKAITLESTTTQGQTARLNASSIVCFIADADLPQHVGEIATAWIFSARLDNVYNGVHRISVNNASTEDRLLFTGAVDRFIFRIGQTDNPVVFASANYTKGIFHREPSTGMLTVAHRAAGADKWRYSLNWGSTCKMIFLFLNTLQSGLSQ